MDWILGFVVLIFCFVGGALLQGGTIGGGGETNILPFIAIIPCAIFAGGVAAFIIPLLPKFGGSNKELGDEAKRLIEKIK